MWYEYEYDGRYVWRITYQNGYEIRREILPYAIPEDYC